LLSSVHGRDRRAQRKIGRRDLQAAVKYGVKKPSRWGGWMYTFANIVYITDKTSRREITSYVLPILIDKVPVSQEQHQLHHELTRLLDAQRHRCTSHTAVLVVDQSGSMRGCDVADFRTRSDAVFGTVALDLLGNLIDLGDVGADVLTLIEMRDTSQIVFNREAVTNVLFNKMLKKQREATPSSHGNYEPALDLCSRALADDMENGSCALLVLFLSDGKPSDRLQEGFTREDLHETLCNQVTVLARTFGQRLTFGTIAFGSLGSDFTLLDDMARAANKGGSKGIFQQPQLSGESLSEAVGSLGSKLSTTRTELSMLANPSGRARVVRSVEREVPSLPLPHSLEKSEPVISDAAGWDIHDSIEVHKAIWNAEKVGDSQSQRFEAIPRPICGIAVRSKSFGEGAERIVFQLREIVRSGDSSYMPHGPHLVGKESRFIESDERKIRFHETFCATQLRARSVTSSFLAQLLFENALFSSYLPLSLPNLTAFGVPSERGILAEKMLDQSRYKKWNGNNGFVHGAQKKAAEAADLADLMDQLRSKDEPLGALVEGDEESESSDEEEEEDEVNDSLPESKQPGAGVSYVVTKEMYPQSFSHFTYRRSKRKLLVCDLQGARPNTNPHYHQPPLFEMTDPVIHYVSSRGRRKVHGRTDHGRKGIHAFFKSHKCNGVVSTL
ncbi:unnamed protein product, partial [Chrysoparadoxa australica]